MALHLRHCAAPRSDKACARLSSPCGGLGVTGARLALAVRLNGGLLVLEEQMRSAAASLAAPARLLAPRTSLPASQAAVANATQTNGDSSGTRVMSRDQACRRRRGRGGGGGARRAAAAGWRRLGTRLHAHHTGPCVLLPAPRTWGEAAPTLEQHEQLPHAPNPRGRAPGPSASSAEWLEAAFAPQFAPVHGRAGGAERRRRPAVPQGCRAPAAGLQAIPQSLHDHPTGLEHRTPADQPSQAERNFGSQPLASPWLAPIHYRSL